MRRVRHYMFREGDVVPDDTDLRKLIHAEWDYDSGIVHVFTVEWVWENME